jgi:phosphohistidine phosphatase
MCCGRSEKAVKTLHLLRHAKSSWDEPELADRDRPLAPRGDRAAALMRGYFHASRTRPALVLCSPALRAKQTLEVIFPALLPDTQVWTEEGIYEATAQDLLQRVRRLDDSFAEVLLIGHNPALHDLADTLAEESDDPVVARLRQKLPTGALVTLLLPEDSWTQLRPGGALVEHFIVPDDLSPRGAESPPT